MNKRNILTAFLLWRRVSHWRASKWEWQMPPLSLSPHIIISNNACNAGLHLWHYLHSQGNFPTVNKTTVTTLDPSTTTMSKRTYSESTDQEMDVWLRLKVSPSSPLIKTVSFTVTPFLLTCSGRDVGYRRCGPAGHCVRSQFFCDGAVNCPVNNSMWPAGDSQGSNNSKISRNCYFFLTANNFLASNIQEREKTC